MASSSPVPTPQDSPRIERVEIEGQVGWLKRQEKLQGRMRFQKGDAGAAYAAERDVMLRYADQGLPVPRVIEVGEDYFVTADAGPTLRTLFTTKDEHFVTNALCDAAKALADLHKHGVAHGRPALRDICWDNGKVTFIDWERYSDKRNRDKGFAEDVLLFFFSAITVLDGAGNAVQAARQVYLENAPAEVWPLAKRRVQRLRWVRTVLSPVIKRLPSKKEFRAVGPFFGFFLHSENSST